MPLHSISGAQAFANIKANRASLWPDGRRDRERLGGLARVQFEPSFQLEPGERVFTVGSCFARNIERRLSQLGFELPARDFALPAEERASETENDFLNKYPPHSILNEFRWALDPAYAFPEDGFFEIRRGLWHDPHSAPNLKPAKRERVEERRAMVQALYSQIPQCRVLVMTLGLIEAWFDEKTGYYLNGAPPTPVMRADPERFRLDVLKPDEIVAALTEIYALLTRYGHPDFRILLTVSPVPMRSTFTGQDAITANTYSKSALRAAAQMFVHGRDRVDYFPSYEIVTLSNRSAAFIQDNRHVTPQLVDSIVDQVVTAYCPTALEAEDELDPIGVRKAATEIRKAMKAADYARACALYAGLQRNDRYRRAGFEEGPYRYEFGRMLLRCGHIAEAQVQLTRAVEADPAHAPSHHQLGRTLARLQRPLQAEESFRRAVALAPDVAEMRLSYANQLSELGRHKEAEEEILFVLKRHAHDPRTEAVFKALRERRVLTEAQGASSSTKTG
jgi:hypothetical protein